MIRKILLIILLIGPISNLRSQERPAWQDSLEAVMRRDSIERLELELENDNSLAAARIEQERILAEQERKALATAEARQREITYAIAFSALSFLLGGISIY